MDRDASAEDEVTRLAAELVRIDSSDPGAYEGELERFVRAWLAPRVDAARAADGTPLATLEELEALPGRTCLRATILAAGAAGAGVAGPGPADLTLCCHMDTVQLGDGWSVDTPALGGIVRDGKLWGRGSCDMKGGLACAMLAFSDALDAVRRRRCAPERSVSLLCTVDEEDVMRGCEAAIRAGWLDGRGWVLDTEPTDSLARGAHKGRTWFELDMSGVTAHASTPWKGADAVAALSEAICHVRRAFQTLAPHASLGTATVTFGQVEGGYSPYVVPGFARVWIDMRLVPPYDTARARHLVEQVIAHAEESVPGRATGPPSSRTRTPSCWPPCATRRAARGTTWGPARSRATRTPRSSRASATTGSACRTGRAAWRLRTSRTSTFPWRTSCACAPCFLAWCAAWLGSAGPLRGGRRGAVRALT